MRNNFIEGFLLSSVFCFSYFWDHWRNSDKENLSLDRKRRRKKNKTILHNKNLFLWIKISFRYLQNSLLRSGKLFETENEK